MQCNADSSQPTSRFFCPVALITAPPNRSRPLPWPCSRATLTFVGWLLAATGNFLLMLTSSHIESESSAALPITTAAAEKKQEVPAASAGSATELAATTA